MSFKFAGRLFGLLAGSLILSGALSAATISGVFNLTGNVQVTATEDVFGNMVIGDNQALTQLQLTGSFSGLTPGNAATIGNLVGPNNTPPGPVTPGTPFSLPNWIVLPDGINLDATSLPLPSNPVCGGAVTDNCVAFAGSPIVLSTQQGGGGTLATFSIFGNAHFAGAIATSGTFAGVFSSQFPGETPLQVIASFGTTGSITDSYSAAFVVTPSTSPVPEPASMALFGAGLLALGFFGKKKIAK